VVKCADKGISVDVKPWVVELSLSAEEPTEWTLDGDAATMRVEQIGQWPYQAPLADVPKGTPRSVTAWRKHVQLGSYRYKITAECELDGRPVSVVIDPDMDVDE
jgi:hypothetical protein